MSFKQIIKKQTTNVKKSLCVSIDVTQFHVAKINWLSMPYVVVLFHMLFLNIIYKHCFINQKNIYWVFSYDDDDKDLAKSKS